MEKSINKDYLLVLKNDISFKTVRIDRIEIPKLYEFEYQQFLKDCNTEISNIDILRKYKHLSHIIPSNIWDKKIKFDLLRFDRENLIFYISKYLYDYRINKAYEVARESKKNKTILFNSHQYSGWYEIKESIGDDFGIVINSNFNYGSASYFYMKFIFKSVPIILNTDVLKYNSVVAKEVKSYTFKYEAENKSWYNLMSDFKTMYDLAVNNQRSFLEQYVVECAHKMTDELKVICSKNEIEYDIRWGGLNYVSFGTTSNKIEYKGDKLIIAADYFKNLITLINKIDFFEIREKLIELVKVFFKISDKESDLIKRKIETLTPSYEEYKKLYYDYYFVNKIHYKYNSDEIQELYLSIHNELTLIKSIKEKLDNINVQLKRVIN